MRNNVKLLQESMSCFCDCAIITSDTNRRYLTGMKSTAGTVVVFRDKAYLIIDFRYIEKARSIVTDCEVVLEQSLISQLGELIKKHGAKTAAVEADSITLSHYNTLKNAMPAEVTSGAELSDAISRLRRIKTDDEVEQIIKAQRIAEQAFDEVQNFIMVGRTEREIALFLDYEMQKRGSEGVSFETIALSGENTSMPHGVPGDRTVHNGDFVLMDYGAVVGGYHSDMTRTVAVGTPSDKMISVYNTVLAAQQAALAAAKANIIGSELDAAARDVITNAGYGDSFGHSLGHGVGLEIHEAPNASPRCNKAIREGAIVTVEPGIYIAGEFGVRIEDMVQVTKDGCKNLTLSEKQLIIL